MELIVRAFPVLPGKEAEMRQFAHDLQTTRAGEATAFYGGLGIGHESWHVQAHAEGLWVIVITEISGRSAAAAASQYAQSQEAFVRWFKDRVQSVTGINPDTTPLGPPTEAVFHMHGDSGKHAGAPR